ncbi:MAG TPA: hypothetical protein VHX66_00290 [Solirubrobacteraceae bacterium]|jgi:hypothetical protein|nr:hypothetical protein [Solirubrobacteraceae bacterium]
MTKNEWKQIAPLLSAWPRRRDEPIAHAVYETVLERFEPSHVADALRDLALTAKHMPTAAEVAQRVRELFLVASPVDGETARKRAWIDRLDELETIRRDNDVDGDLADPRVFAECERLLVQQKEAA